MTYAKILSSLPSLNCVELETIRDCIDELYPRQQPQKIGKRLQSLKEAERSLAQARLKRLKGAVKLLQTTIR